MYKLLLVFFMVISSPLYSNEFTYRCDEGDNFTMVYDVNLTERSIIHIASIYHSDKTIQKVDKNLEIFFWDEKYNSVWTVNYRDEEFTIPTITSKLFNFELQTLQSQSMRNDTTFDGSVPKNHLFGRNRTFKCNTRNR